MKTKDKLDKLRGELKSLKLDGFIIPRTDEFQGEYVPACAERLSYITGFTGSAGLSVVLDNKAMVMSDGRYDIQLKQQVESKYFETHNISNLSVSDWLIQQSRSLRVGYDPKLHTVSELDSLQRKLSGHNIELVPLEKNPVDLVWSGQPAPPQEKVHVFSEKISGKTGAEKVLAISEQLKKNKAQAFVLTAPDSIAWLLNIRGGDVAHTPVALSYAIVHQGGELEWFIDTKKIDQAVRKHVGNKVHIKEIDTMPRALKELARNAVNQNQPVLLDYNNTAVWFKDFLESNGAALKSEPDPCIIPRACKTVNEQKAIANAHIKDGVAMVRFLKWVDENAASGKLDELGVEKKLMSFRKQDKDLTDCSFDTIAGFAGNGAIVHYRATENTNKKIVPPGLLLVDSGGQYKSGGTTDITRTITIGKPTEEMKENFTRVLMGHIDVAKLVFPEGTTGAQIDVLARQALWEKNLDFAHGTGHGVGCYLSVHESGVGISPRANAAFMAGMLVSNEPGYYKENEYGIRIENLVLVKEDKPVRDSGPYSGRKMFSFETVTLAPIDRNLIKSELLSESQLAWLNSYHARVLKTLSPLLDKDEVVWLEKATAPIIQKNKPVQVNAPPKP
jgi:Xaa-Pro aminopeptidase